MGSVIARDWVRRVFVLTCVEPRIDEDKLFTGLQEAFPDIADYDGIVTHRPVGAIIDDNKKYEDLSLNAKVALSLARGIDKLFVVGHTDCASARALVHGSDNASITNFLKAAESVRQSLPKINGHGCDHIYAQAEEGVVHLSARNLETLPDIIAMRDQITIRSAMMDIHTHIVTKFNMKSGAQGIITPAHALNGGSSSHDMERAP